MLKQSHSQYLLYGLVLALSVSCIASPPHSQQVNNLPSLPPCTSLPTLLATRNEGERLSGDKEEKVKGPLNFFSHPPCDQIIASVQYMYRLLPVSNLSPMGHILQEKGFHYQFNTLILTDGSYEVLSKAILKNGETRFSKPLKLQIANGGYDNPQSTSVLSSPFPSEGGKNPIPSGNLRIDVNPRFDVLPGTVKWSLRFPTQISGLLVEAANLYVVAGNRLSVYDSDGVKIGELSLGRITRSASTPLAIFKKQVAWGDDSGQVHLVDISNPHAMVETSGFPVQAANLPFHHQPPVFDCQGNIYLESSEQRLLKIRQATGQVEILTQPMAFVGPNPKQTGTQQPHPSALLINGGEERIIWGSANGVQMLFLTGKIYTTFNPRKTCNATQNCELVSQGLDLALNSPLAIDAAGMGYIANQTGTLFKFDPSGGQEHWKTFVGKLANAPVIGSDGTVYTVSQTGVFKALYGITGKSLFEVQLDNAVVHSSPVIGKGSANEDIIYLGTASGWIYSFNGIYTGSGRGHAGSMRFKKNLGSPIYSNLRLDSQGILYAVTQDHQLHAIYSDSRELSPTAHWAQFQGTNLGSGQIGENCS